MSKKSKKASGQTQKTSSPDASTITLKKPVAMWVKKLALALVMPVLLLGLAEGALRMTKFIYAPQEKLLWKPTISGFIGTYEFYIPTDFAPPGYIWLSKPNSPYTDRNGFRLPEIPFEKPEGKVRVAFLGGSTTHGGYRPYPERAIRLINAALGTNQYEMLNVACSSYSTHQSLIALERWALPRKPDIVFVYHGWNDMFLTTDGYSDKEKDSLLSVTGEAKFTLPPTIRELRLTGLLGKLAERMGGTWPRQRVAFEDFEGNLDKMARMCADQGVKMIVMIRPEQRKERFVHHPMEAVYDKFARQTFNTTNAYEMYKKQSDRIIEIQRKIAGRYPHVRPCDGHQKVFDLLDRSDAGEFGESVPIFYSDNCHLLEFPDELLSQHVAVTIAPEHAVAISNRINSVDYEIAMAVELIREDAPREAIWFIERAQQRNPAPEQAEQLASLKSQAEANFELVDLFRTGRWGGDDPVFESKITDLKRCLQIRPSDYGIMIQIYRVCIYMNRLEEAAAAFVGFQPQNVQQQYEWMNYTLESHLQGKRWRLSRRMAEEILKLVSDHPLANSVLQQIPANI